METGWRLLTKKLEQSNPQEHAKTWRRSFSNRYRYFATIAFEQSEVRESFQLLWQGVRVSPWSAVRDQHTWLMLGAVCLRPVLPGYIRDELRYLAAKYLQRNSSGGMANSEDPQVDDWRDLPDVNWGGWKITRVLAEALDARLAELAPRRILEVGSGVSTAILAAYARRTGAELVTLEHNPVFYMRTKRLLRVLGLEPCVNLRLSRLAKRKRLRGKPRCYWYQTKLRGTFDFILLDGPPGGYGRIAALPALAGILPRAGNYGWMTAIATTNGSVLMYGGTTFPLPANFEQLTRKSLGLARDDRGGSVDPIQP